LFDPKKPNKPNKRDRPNNGLLTLADFFSILLTPLLGQQTNVGHHVLHFPVCQLASPRMHGAEDDPVFNGPQQFFVGFQKGRKTVEVGRRDPEGLCVRSIPPTSDTVAVLAIALIHAYAACDIGWKILCMEERCDKEADEAHAQRGCHATKENTHHTS
jgi:hypothetical protein